MIVRPMKRVLHKSQSVNCRGENADRRHRCNHQVPPIGSLQDQEFTDEVAQSGQPHRRQRKEKSKSTESWYCRPQSSKLTRVPRVRPLLQRSHEDEQCAGAQAVAEHSHYRSLQRQFIPSKDSHENKSEMTHTRISDKALEVRLAECEESAVDDPGGAQCHRHGRELTRGARK